MIQHIYREWGIKGWNTYSKRTRILLRTAFGSIYGLHVIKYVHVRVIVRETGEVQVVGAVGGLT